MRLLKSHLLEINYSLFSVYILPMRRFLSITGGSQCLNPCDIGYILIVVIIVSGKNGGEEIETPEKLGKSAFLEHFHF